MGMLDKSARPMEKEDGQAVNERGKKKMGLENKKRKGFMRDWLGYRELSGPDSKDFRTFVKSNWNRLEHVLKM